MKKVIITTKWIPVEEAMPPEMEDVLVFYPNSKYGEIRIDCWFTCDNGRFALRTPTAKRPTGCRCRNRRRGCSDEALRD